MVMRLFIIEMRSIKLYQSQRTKKGKYFAAYMSLKEPIEVGA